MRIGGFSKDVEHHRKTCVKRHTPAQDLYCSSKSLVPKSLNYEGRMFEAQGYIIVKSIVQKNIKE